jgi:serine protease inhibitor
MLFMEPKTIGLCTITALTVLLIVFTGCTGTAPVQPISPTGERTPVGQVPGIVTDANRTRVVTNANNRFAFDLYSQLAPLTR